MRPITFFVLVWFHANSLCQTVKILNNPISLYHSDTVQICSNLDFGITWSTNNRYFKVSQKGKVFLDSIPPIGKKTAEIYAETANPKTIDSIEITAVDWITRKSKIEIEKFFPNYQILAQIDNFIYFSSKGILYRTNSAFKGKERVGNVPANARKIITTPYGYYLISNGIIYSSSDMKSWKIVFQANHSGLNQSFDYFFDETSKKLYLYFGEYTAVATDSHNLYRGIINSDGKTRWDTILHFFSRSVFPVNKMRPVAFHIHTVAVDPYTGYIWVATGDDDYESAIYYSADYGDSFHLLGIGKQDFRPLSIWFTKDFIYWNMDTAEPQSIWRIPRSAKSPDGMFPSMNPVLIDGNTKPGLKYYVVKSQNEAYFPVSPGFFYTETIERPLSKDYSVLPFNDEDYYYKEKVAFLSCGSMWYITHATVNGNDVVIMSVSASANYYDRRNRVFGLKERIDGSVDIQELISLTSPWKDEYAQLEPFLQDDKGFIYFLTRAERYYGMLQTSLIWNDSDKMSYIQENCPTGFFKGNSSNNYLIYPNPSNGKFHVYNKLGFEPYIEYIFDFINVSSGQKVYTQKMVFSSLQMEATFDLSKIQGGIYAIRIFKEENFSFGGLLDIQ